MSLSLEPRSRAEWQDTSVRRDPARGLSAWWLVLIAALLSACAARRPTDADERDSFEWLVDSPYVPAFDVLDTESSLGPYAPRSKRITIDDLVKMHGHVCDGLVTAACALQVGLDALYPDGVVDRTDTGCITKNSPCYGDVAAYLTGGRVRFGTQKIDPSLGNEFVLYRFSTGQAVRASLREGRFPRALADLETKLRSGDFTDEEMRACQRLGWDFARELLQHPPTDSFEVQVLPELTWTPDAYEHLGPRGDVIHKDR